MAIAESLSSGSGWAVLRYARQDGKLYNQLACDDSQAITDAVPLLVLDMYEHAYQTEFGANATAYMEAFMRNVDWTVVTGELRERGFDARFLQGGLSAWLGAGGACTLRADPQVAGG